MALKTRTESLDKFKNVAEANASRPLPKWLERSDDGFSARIVSLPAREDIDLPVEEHLIVDSIQVTLRELLLYGWKPSESWQLKRGADMRFAMVLEGIHD